jgi:hypothetical protein
MKKDAYYFSHDSNAWTDPKILKLRVIYKDKSLWAYGLFWIILEKMRDESEHRLGHDSIDEIALYSQCNSDEIRTYIDNCINVKLFESDGKCFWSISFLNRMEQYHDKCEKARNAINKRWDDEKNKRNTDVIPTYNEGNTLKETKLKEIKEKKENEEESQERGNKPESSDDLSGYRMKASGRAITVKEFVTLSSLPGYRDRIEKINEE